MTDAPPRATATVQVDNDHARITRWDFAPGAATGFHRHEMDYAVVPLNSGRLKLIDADGEVAYAELTAGATYFREAGVAHDVVNDGAGPFAFVEVEFK